MSSAFGASGSPVNEQEEVPEIQTQLLGFKGLNGDKKAKVLPRPWPQDALPPSHASLLSIASANGLYAAGGPEALVIGRTSAVRERIYDTASKEDVRDSAPVHTIPHQRLAHVVFAADESCLVVAEQESAAIIVYSTSDLLSRHTKIALRLATSAPIRSITPNPDPAQAQYFAILTTNGQLHLADLGSGQLGPALAENVACMVWSNKGKQLMAGKGDGTALQLKTDGTMVATAGKPNSVPANCHLAQIAWVENDVFFFIYTPSQPQDVNDIVSEYYIVKTDKGRSSWNFHKIGNDPFFPQVNRTPAHFHLARLRNYAPNLEEFLVFTATISPDVRMVTKAKQPLSSEITQQDAYALTIPESDGRMAALPVGEDMSDTTAIGMAIDLSDKDPIVRPLPTDPEYENSNVPLPELVTLNNEGVMSIWAVVYDDGVRSNKPYSGFEDIAKIQQVKGAADASSMDTAAPAIHQPPQPVNSTFNVSSSALPFSATPSNPQTPAFGQASTFGTGSGFSKRTPIGGEQKSSWASTGFSAGSQQGSALGGTPAFGSTPALGSSSKPAFGQTATPAFGQTGFGQTPKPAFGQSSFGTQASQSSPFSSASKPQASSGFGAGSGFGAFAGTGGGFGAVKIDSKSETSFGNFGGGGGFSDAKPASPFAAASTSISSPFGQATGQPAFGTPSPFGGAAASTSSPFGQAAKGFKVESTFEKDETSMKDDDNDDGGSFGFGAALGGALGAGKTKAENTQTKEEEMGDDNEQVDNSAKPKESPPSTISRPKTTTTPHVQSLFGQSTTPQTQPKNLSTGWNFGNVPSTTPKETPAPQKSIFGTKSTSEETPAAVEKSEPARPFSFSSKSTTSPFATAKDNDKPSIFGKASDTKPIFGQSKPPVPIFGTKSTVAETPARVEKSEPKNTFAFGVTELSDSDRVRSLSDEEDEQSTPEKVPEAPLPPDPSSKPGFQAGDTSASSTESKDTVEPDDAPLPPDFMPANKTSSQSLKTEPSDVPLSAVSSDFDEGSGEDVTGDMSPVEERDEHDETTQHVETSPESSFGRVSDHDSPTGGPFTKILKAPEPSKGGKLFGEMSSAPFFAPPQPKPQESPRSPSPMRKPARQTMLSPERSFSAPAQPRQSVIQQRKQEYAHSPFGLQAEKARQESVESERARYETARKEQEAAKAAEQRGLEDDEDAILQEELAKPLQPSVNLDPFLTVQIGKSLQDPATASRTDIPAQIEKLYQDINSMVVTLGINARSLGSYMLCQSSQQPNEQWPAVLASDTPMDALNDEWYLGDIPTLPAGSRKLDELSSGLEISDVMQKLEDCHTLLTKEVGDLRQRIIALRKSTSHKAQPADAAHAPLSAEQLSVQSDLRKSSANVLTSLTKVEEDLVLLRAKIADLAPAQKEGKKFYAFGGPAQKKPSIEAVMNTVSKMTSMAEKRSADVDVLEVQMKKLGIASERPSTPQKQIRHAPVTPKSGASSVYHTPGSTRSRSARGTPARNQALFSAEDRERLLAKTRRKMAVADTLKEVLKERHATKV